MNITLRLGYGKDLLGNRPGTGAVAQCKITLGEPQGGQQAEMRQARTLKPGNDLPKLGDANFDASRFDQPVTANHSCRRSIEWDGFERQRLLAVSQPLIGVTLLNSRASRAPQTGYLEPEIVEEDTVF